MRRFTPLALAFLLVGCAEIIDEPPPTIEPPDPEPVPQLPAMTLKGPTAVTPGDRPMYKAGQFRSDVTYRYEINDSQPVLQRDDDDDDNDRFFFTEVVGEGQAELRVTAIDADGNEIAFARRWIDSRY